jgi:hypothetical protein
MHEILECLCLIMFNYEMWTNPQWSFGWPPALFLWMGRRRAGLVALLGESLENSLDATPFIVFGVVVSMALIRGRSWIFIFIMSVVDFWDYVLVKIYVVWWHGYLVIYFIMDDCWDDLFKCRCNDVLFRCDVWENYLCIIVGELLKM